MSSYTEWKKFFVDAGIPPTVASNYAMTFSEHRIQMDMLKEINKEILLDMGIKAMGDIIAILRHAKNIYTKSELKVTTTPTPAPINRGISSVSTANPTTTTINKIDRVKPQHNTHAATAARFFKPTPLVSSGPGKVSLRSGVVLGTQRTSVSTGIKDRLGKSSVVAAAAAAPIPPRLKSTVFARLGDVNPRT